MKYLKNLLFTLLMLVAQSSYAGGATPAAHITNLLFYEGHQGILVQVTTMIDPDACGRLDWFILPDTYFHFKEAYGTLLAAKLANKRVSITVSGCLQGLPKIMHISLPAE